MALPSIYNCEEKQSPNILNSGTLQLIYRQVLLDNQSTKVCEDIPNGS